MPPSSASLAAQARPRLALSGTRAMGVGREAGEALGRSIGGVAPPLLVLHSVDTWGHPLVEQKGKAMATTTEVKEGFLEEGTADRALLPVLEATARGGGGRGAGGSLALPPGRGLHSRPLQQLLLLPIGLHHLLRHQLHQLQTLLDLHQDLKVLPAPHLSREADPLPSCVRASSPPQTPSGSLRGPWTCSFEGSPTPHMLEVCAPSFLPGSRQEGLPVHTNRAHPSHRAFPRLPALHTSGELQRASQQIGASGTRASFLAQQWKSRVHGVTSQGGHVM